MDLFSKGNGIYHSMGRLATRLVLLGRIEDTHEGFVRNAGCRAFFSGELACCTIDREIRLTKHLLRPQSFLNQLQRSFLRLRTNLPTPQVHLHNTRQMTHPRSRSSALMERVWIA